MSRYTALLFNFGTNGIHNSIIYYRHMKEHEKDEFVDFSKMTQGQIIMHHFRQFDQNKDGKVDGLEIFKKIQRENGMKYFID